MTKTEDESAEEELDLNKPKADVTLKVFEIEVCQKQQFTNRQKSSAWREITEE